VRFPGDLVLELESFQKAVRASMGANLKAIDPAIQHTVLGLNERRSGRGRPHETIWQLDDSFLHYI